jgi:hypothetical protein
MLRKRLLENVHGFLVISLSGDLPDKNGLANRRVGQLKK